MLHSVGIVMTQILEIYTDNDNTITEKWGKK